MTYVWRDGKLVELCKAPPEARIHIQTDAGFENLRASDGTDLTSRSKWKSYMHENGLTLASDFKETWAKAAERRAAVVEGRASNPARLESIRRAFEMNPRDVRAIGERARERHHQYGKEGLKFRGD